MRYYLSGPMTGRPEHNFPEFSRIAEHLRARHMDVLSPHELDTDLAPGTMTWEWYLKRDIKAMMDCDAIILMSNWEESRGARVELTVADKVKMFVYDLDDNLNIQPNYTFGNQNWTLRP